MAAQETPAIPEETEEQWRSECIDLEASLTIYQLMLLLRAKEGLEGMGAFEPVWPYCTPDRLKVPLYQAALALSETVLLQCAQAQALERMGLVSLSTDEEAGPVWRLTQKGEVAVDFWRESLQELLPTPESSAT